MPEDHSHEHVATAAEEERLLPPGWGNTVDDRFEIVWWVNNESGVITRGSMIDTYESLYTEVTIVENPLGGLYPLSVDNEWHPCEED